MEHVIRHCILIVEDEPLLRIDTVDMMEDEGFNTLEAASADTALLLLESDNAITVLCTDIDMPGSMDGLALAQIVRHRSPKVAIVVASGHHHPDETELPDRSLFVPKPYSRSAILDALKAALQ